MATTRSRSIGRETARPSSHGPIAEHMPKIYAVAIAGIIVVVAFLTFTGIGHTIDLATQHFMLFYAGVFALIALCASVGLGLVATDRMVLNPGHRVFVQSMHRIASFGALAFLIIHIVTEILAQRVHVIDAFVPFLAPFKTFYIGLGTIASDLILLLVVTSVFRSRFTTNGKAWRWRAIHYMAYAAFVFGVWHGLLGGRPGKPYVDWSYGFVIAFVALGVGVRVIANSLRPKEKLSSPAVDERSTSSAPLRAATLGMAAQVGGKFQALGRGGQTSTTMTATALSARPTSGPMPALTALPAGGTVEDGRQPFYEQGYEGPPRFVGAPRASDSGPMPRVGTGPMPRASDSGPMPRVGTGPMPRMSGSGPMQRPAPRPATGPIPRAATGPMPRAGGPAPRPATGPMPRANGGARPGTGPMPRPGTGPMPRAGGPAPRPATGPMPRANGGARPGTGPMPRAGGPAPRPATGPMPRANGGPRRGNGNGASPRGQAPRKAPPPEQWSDEQDGFGGRPYGGSEGGRGGGWG